MKQLRYTLRKDWIFYLLVLGYSYLILKMTVSLWFGGGINIFASYTEVTTLEETLLNANKVYWSKTCFLFLTLFLFALNFDYRFVVGIAATFWATSLIMMFGINPTLIAVGLIGVALIIQQVVRKQILSASNAQ